MTRSRTKKAKEALDKEVNYFLSLKPASGGSTLKIVQIIQVDEEPNMEA